MESRNRIYTLYKHPINVLIKLRTMTTITRGRVTYIISMRRFVFLPIRMPKRIFDQIRIPSGVLGVTGVF